MQQIEELTAQNASRVDEILFMRESTSVLLHCGDQRGQPSAQEHHAKTHSLRNFYSAETQNYSFSDLFFAHSPRIPKLQLLGFLCAQAW